MKTLWLLPLLFTTLSFAHYPQIGQIVRYQPMLKRNSPSFVSTGTLEIQGTRLPYTLEWTSGKDYIVTVENVPNSFVNSDSTSSGNWKLQRKNDQCLIQAGRKVAPCTPPSLWALLELSSQTTEVVSNLKKEFFISDTEALYTETNSKDPKTENSENIKRPELIVTQFGNQPKAVLQIKNLKYSEGDSAQAIEFDQTHLLPVKAQFKFNDSLFSYESTIGQWGKKENSRFKAILSTRLKVFKGKDPIGILERRQNEAAIPSNNKTALKDGFASLDSLRGELSLSGERLLDFLMLSH